MRSNPQSPFNRGDGAIKSSNGTPEFVQRVKEALFGILFVIHKNDHAERFWPIVEVIIDHLQDLAFPISTFFPWQDEIGWFVRALELVSAPEHYASQTGGIFEVLICSLGVTLLNTLWVGYSFSTNNFQFIWPLKTLRVLLTLFANVLYVPSVTVLLIAVTNCEEHSTQTSEALVLDAATKCWTGGRLFASLATAAVALIFICLAFTVTATFFEPDPKDHDITCRPHSRLDLWYVMARTILILLHSVLPIAFKVDSVTPKWIMALASLAASGSLAFGSIWYMSYYHWRYAMFRAALQCNFLWASLCCVYTLIRPHSDIGIIYLLQIPLMMAVCLVCIRFRREHIEGMDLKHVNPITLELKVRFRLMRSNLLFRATPTHNMTLETTSPGDLGYTGPDVQANTAEQAIREKERLAIEETNGMFVHGLRRMAGSCFVRLFAGQFHLLQMGNKAQCLAAYEKASTLGPTLDEAFLIFRRKRMLHERFAGGDVIDFIAFEQNMQQAKKYERRAMAAVLQFWEELARKKPSFESLQAHGATISAAVSLAQSHYIALIRLSPNSSSVFRLFGHFLLNILNDNKQAQEMLGHADKLEEENAQGGREDATGYGGDEQYENGGREPSATDPFAPDNALITISGDPRTLGQVLNVNNHALKLFGLRKPDVLHKNIITIIPSPFAEIHDQLLQRYLDTGYAKVIDRPRQVLGLHSSGYIMPVSLLVKQVIGEGGSQTFLGVLNQVPQRSDEDFIITDEKLNIYHFSRGCTALFQRMPESRELREAAVALAVAQGPALSDWIPDATLEKAAELTGRARLKTELKINDVTLDVRLSGSEVRVQNITCYIFKINHSVMESLPALGVNGHLTVPEQGERMGCPFAASRTDLGGGAIPLAFSEHSLANNGDGSAGQLAVDPPHHAINGMRRRHGSPRELINRPKAGIDDDRQSTSSSRGGSRGLKNLIAVKNNVANQRLRYLTLLIIISLAILSTMAVVENILYRQMYATMNRNFAHVELQSEACYRAVGVLDAVRTLQLAREFGHDEVGLYEVDGAVLQMHEDLGFFQSVVMDFMDDPSALIAGTSESRNLLEVTNSAVAAIAFILVAAANDTTSRERMESLLQDIGPTMLKGMNISAARPMQSEKPSVGQNFGIASIGVALYVAIFACFIWPLFCLIEDNRKQFLRIFLSIPKEVTKGIHESYLQRFTADEDEDSADSADDADIGRRLMREKLINGGEGSGASQRKPEISRKPLDGRQDAETHPGRFSWMDVRDSHYLIPKALAVLVVAFALFYSGAGLTQAYLDEGNTVGRQIFWASQAKALLRQIDILAREQYVGAVGSAVPNVTFELPGLPESSAVFERINRGLIYGSSQMGIPSIIASGDAAFNNMLLVDACTAGSPESCETFADGILAHGLQNALEWYGRTVKKVAPLASQASSSPAALSDLLSVSKLIRSLSQNYLPPSYNTAMTLWRTPLDHKSQWFATYHLAFTIAFVCGMPWVYGIFFRPLVKGLAEDITRTHVMLFMIPPGVLGKAGIVQEWLNESKAAGRQPSSAGEDIRETAEMSEDTSIRKGNKSNQKKVEITDAEMV